MNDAFVFYKSYFDYINQIGESNPELVPDLVLAIVNYGIYEEYDTSNPLINMAMVSIKKGIDNAHNRFESSQKNGSKGGANNKKYDYWAIYERKVSGGLKNTELAEEFGCSVKTISRALKDVEDNYKTYCPAEPSSDKKDEFNF